METMINFSYFTRPQLKVLPALSTDFAVAWLLALVGTQDPFLLLGNVVLAILALMIALSAERQLEP